MKHKLIIKSLHDAMLECSCGHWYACRTGKMSKQEAIEEHKQHIKDYK